MFNFKSFHAHTLIGTVILFCYPHHHTLQLSQASSSTSPLPYSQFPLRTIPVPTNRIPRTNLTILHPPSHAPHNVRTSYLLTCTDATRFTIHATCQLPLQRTSEQLLAHSCDYATNGGPFHTDGTCDGVVIAHGNLVANNFPSDNVGFGLGTQPTHSNYSTSASSLKQYYWVVGAVKNAHHAQQLQLQHYLTGFHWLVYEEQVVVVDHFNNTTTGADRAPRTAIGVTRDGILLLLVSDGCQWCLRRRGFTLNELAHTLMDAGAAFAINLDGGSSSVLVQKDGALVNNPTCLDVLPLRCERPVASIVCLRNIVAGIDSFLVG